MRIVNSYIATQYHSKVHTCLEFSYYDEANETTTRFITLSISSDIKGGSINYLRNVFFMSVFLRFVILRTHFRLIL